MSVPIARGKYLFPYRTQQSSLSAVTILGPSSPGKIARCRFMIKLSIRGGLFLYPGLLQNGTFRAKNSDSSLRRTASTTTLWCSFFIPDCTILQKPFSRVCTLIGRGAVLFSKSISDLKIICVRCYVSVTKKVCISISSYIKL